MLSFFRRLINSKVGVIVTFLVLGLVALAFAAGDVTGLRSTGSGAMTGTTVAEVGGFGIGTAELRQRAQNEMEAAQAQQPTLTMAQFVAAGGFDAAVERAINGLALEAFGRNQGMVVSKRAVDGQIASIPALQGPTGKFDQQIYQRLLAERHLSDHAIRDDIARDTLGQQLTVPTIGASQVPQQLALPYASLLLEKRSGTIGFIPAKAMGAGAVPTAAELQTYYQRNVARYTLPERRVIRYALVTPDAVKAQATPTDAEIAQAYQADRAQYAPTEKRSATQVVVLDQAAAAALAAKVKAGTAIDAAARAAGLEPQTLTAVTRSDLTRQTSAAVADAVFGAAQGTVVGPVRGAVGFVVARVTAIEQVAGRSLAQARPEIAKTLATQKTQAALGKAHDALDDAIGGNATFGELVSDQKLAAQVTPAITANGIDPQNVAARPDPALAQVVAAGFQAEQGDDPQLVTVGTDGGFAVVSLDHVVAAAPQPLATVRGAVARDFTIDRAKRAARQVASGVLAKANGGTALAQALKATGLALPPTQTLAASRAQLAAAPNGASAPLALLFSMVGGTTKMLEAPNDSGWLIVHLDTVQSADATSKPQVVGATRQDLGRVVGQEYVQQFVAAVKQQVGVKKNDAAIAGVRADLTGQGVPISRDRGPALRALAAGRPALVWRRQVADTETPVAAALKLIEPGRGDFLLESVEGGATRGRHSLIGLAPDLVFRASGDAAEINRAWLTDRQAFDRCGRPPLAALRMLVESCRMDVPAELPQALACLVGYFGYETIALVEDLAVPEADPLELPDMMFVRPTVVLLFDRLADALFLVAPAWPNAMRPPEAIVAEAAERIDAVAARLATAALPEPVRGEPHDIALTPTLPAGRYGEMVARAQDYILAGDIFQVVLAQRFCAPFALPPFELYRALRRVNPSPFLYHLDLPGFALTGSSPEILVRVRDGEITVRPIAGTRPRGRTADEDEANRASLLADPKERAEHLMLLDLGRNDIGRAAAPGSVRVTDSYTVELYSHVMHIVSNVVGRLAEGRDALDALFAGFPAGTVSGAPKVRACQIIAELEREKRGAYAGGVGYFSPDGSMDSCIVLRTAVVKDGMIHVQAGAGIVADSDPAYEQRECEAKAGALLAAAREAIVRAADAGFGQ